MNTQPPIDAETGEELAYDEHGMALRAVEPVDPDQKPAPERWTESVLNAGRMEGMRCLLLRLTLSSRTLLDAAIKLHVLAYAMGRSPFTSQDQLARFLGKSNGRVSQLIKELSPAFGLKWSPYAHRAKHRAVVPIDKMTTRQTEAEETSL